MYELKKNLERYLRVSLLGPGPRLIKKEFTGPLAVSQRMRNTDMDDDIISTKYKALEFDVVMTPINATNI
jgi:hypothetical protein